jgi:hypothetical protein
VGAIFAQLTARAQIKMPELKKRSIGFPSGLVRITCDASCSNSPGSSRRLRRRDHALKFVSTCPQTFDRVPRTRTHCVGRRRPRLEASIVVLEDLPSVQISQEIGGHLWGNLTRFVLSFTLEFDSRRLHSDVCGLSRTLADLSGHV